MKIFIRFAGDNDFINTMWPVMEVIRLRILHENLQRSNGSFIHPVQIPPWIMDKDKVVEFVNRIIYAMYLGFQADFELRGRGTNTEEYLTIEAKDVLYDKEVDAFTNYNHDGAVYDTDMESYGLSPIYAV